MEPIPKRLRTQHPESDAVSICSTDSETLDFSNSESDTTYDHKRPSPFLSLPRELRSMIYQYAFSTSSSRGELVRITAIRYHLDPRPGHTHPKSARGVTLKYTREPAVHLPVALLSTNRQIYHEALPVLFSGVAFGFACNPTSLTFLLDRFSDTARNSIRYLRLYPAPLYVRNGPLGEQLSWAVLCAQVARLPSLRRVEILYEYFQDLKDDSIATHRALYGKWLDLISATKEPIFGNIPTAAELAEYVPQFRDIIEPVSVITS